MTREHEMRANNLIRKTVKIAAAFALIMGKMRSGIFLGLILCLSMIAAACGGGGGGGGSNSSTPATIPTTPTDVTAVTATPGNGEVTIAWTAVAGATSYNIYWSTTTGVTTANGTEITGATNPYIQTGLTNEVTYYYLVTAVNSVGESAASAQVSAIPAVNPAPAAPTDVTATPGNGEVTIAWTAVAGAISYNIYWSTTTGVTTADGTEITGATNPYIQTGLTNGTTYYYVVTAVNDNGESTASPQVTAAPTDVVMSNYSVTESWSVTLFLGNGTTIASTTYTGTETGILAIGNDGTYTQINHTGVSGIAPTRTINFPPIITFTVSYHLLQSFKHMRPRLMPKFN